MHAGLSGVLTRSLEQSDQAKQPGVLKTLPACMLA
jgi:hypothetical protein